MDKGAILFIWCLMTMSLIHKLAQKESLNTIAQIAAMQRETIYILLRETIVPKFFAM